MSEVNIDALSSEELKEQAKVLGLSLKGNPSDETLRHRIREALGESSGNPPEEADIKASDDTVVININPDKDNKQPVPVGLNGRVYRIRRGENVTVPAGVVNVLRDAVQVHFDPDTGEKTTALAYPFSIVG